MELLSRIDPNQAPVIAIVFLFIIGNGFFIWRGLWPWFTKDYWPRKFERDTKLELAKIDLEKEQNDLIRTVRDAMLEIKVYSGQQLILIQQSDSKTSATLQLLQERQRAVLERLNIKTDLNVNEHLPETTLTPV